MKEQICQGQEARFSLPNPLSQVDQVLDEMNKNTQTRLVGEWGRREVNRIYRPVKLYNTECDAEYIQIEEDQLGNTDILDMYLDSNSQYQRAQELERSELTSQDLEKITLDELKEMRTMSERIGYVMDNNMNEQEFAALEERDPEFMKPIITGVKKRPGKVVKAMARINRRSKGHQSSE